jgi:hypothetical protein
MVGGGDVGGVGNLARRSDVGSSGTVFFLVSDIGVYSLTGEKTG